jgi:alpha-mannosidase
MWHRCHISEPETPEDPVPSIREILLVPHTHHDVGYTNSPRIVDDAHRRIVGEVLDLAERGPAEGPDAFRWTFEVARPVLRFLEQAEPADADRLRALARAGRIAVTGGYLNMTQLPSEAEFDVTYDAVRRLREAGLTVHTEQHGDVNGTAWGTVDGMRRAGLDRLVMALNPDHGRPPFAQPTGFWWEGVSGRRIFVWLSTHYGYGEEWGIVDGDTGLAERSIAEFVRGLEARDDYPYDTALVHAANDNRWPTALFLDVVRHWNRSHPDVPMRTATVDDALDVLVRQAARADVPVVRGEWSDWWSHGHGSTAREVAVYREARSFARAAQSAHSLSMLRGEGVPALATVLGYRRGPVGLRSAEETLDDLDRVDEQLLLFGEHTWGSWETYSKPFSTFSHSHWNAKAGFAYAAYDWARDLAIEGMYRALASGPETREDAMLSGQSSIVVLNPSERDRTEPVSVEVAGSRRARAVATVPAFGAAVVPVPEALRERTGRTLEFGAYRVVVDPARGGVVSLVHRPTRRELVDPAADSGLGAVVVEEVDPASSHPMLTRSPKDFHPDFPGPEFSRRVATGDTEPRLLESESVAQLVWKTTPPGLPEAVTTLSLYRDSEAVDLDVALAKPERFGPESIFVAFPFLAADPEFLLETAGAVYAADTEQLPDTSKDWYSIQHAIGVNDGGGAGIHGAGILWGSFDAPLVQLGDFQTGRWARTLTTRGGWVNSWLMNNLHFTNFQARQEGTRTYRYRFVPAPAPVRRDEVRVFGRNLLEPLQGRTYDGPVRLSGGSGLRVEPSDRVLAELRPVAGGAVRLRLRNVTGDPVVVTVGWDGPGDVTVVPMDTSEAGGGVRIEAHGTADLLLRRVGG